VEISQLQHCTKCPELVTNRKNVVTMEGHCPAEILFLTNAPRAREDTQRKPIAGISGKFFMATIRALGLNTHFRLAFVPVVMCMPPGRPPTDKEISACSSNIQNLIRVTQPKVVVAMGAHAHSFVLGVPLHNIRPIENCGEIVYSNFEGALHNNVPVILTFEPNQVLQERLKFEGIYVRHLRAAARLVYAPPRT
jgi:DNA polymerase